MGDMYYWGLLSFNFYCIENKMLRKITLQFFPVSIVCTNL